MKFVQDKDERKVILAYLAVCILWGSTYLAIKIGVSAFPPMLFAGFRFVIAGGSMLLYAKIKGLRFPKSSTEVRKISVVGLFLLLGGNGIIVWVEQWINSGFASLLVATVPLFMAIIDLVMNGSKSINIKGWIGLFVGFGGVAILVLSNSNTGTIDIKGSLLILLGAFSWALGSVYSKGFKPVSDTVTVIGIQMTAGGIGLCIVGALFGEFSKINLNATGILAMLYLIVFGSIIGYSCYIYILQKWPSAKAGTYAYVNPPVAVFLGALILKEAISIYVILSTIVILAGVVLVQTSKIKKVTKEISNEIK